MKICENSDQLLGYIKKFNLENILKDEFYDLCSLHTFEKGEYICEIDQIASYFYFFVEGKAKIYTLVQNGKKLLIRFYSPFNVLGDIEVINEQPYKVFAEALNACVCIGIPIKAARIQGLKNPDFLKFLCEHLVEKLDTITHKSSVNMLYSLEVRLASYIYESHNKQTLVFEAQSNYSDLAELLGTSYRHLNRTLLQKKKKKILKKDGKNLVIMDQEALKELSKDLYL